MKHGGRHSDKQSKKKKGPSQKETDLTKKTLLGGGSVGVVKAPPRLSAAAAGSDTTETMESKTAVALQMLENVKSVQKIGTVVPMLAETRIHDLACTAFAAGEQFFIAADSDQVVVVRLHDSDVVLNVRAPNDSSEIGAITTFAITTNPDLLGLITAHTTSKLVRVWTLDLKKGIAEEQQTIKLSGCVVTCLSVGPVKNRMLAIGCSDGVCRVYDLESRYFTHVIKPEAFPQGHAYVHSAVFVNNDRSVIISHCSDTGTNDSTSSVIYYDLHKKATLRSVSERHISKIAAVTVHDDLLITSGHDNTINVYDIATFDRVKSFASFETMDSLAIFDDDKKGSEIIFLVGASITKGNIYLWRYTRGKKQLIEKMGEYPLPVVSGVLIMFASQNHLTIVSDDYKLLIVPLTTPSGISFTDPKNKGMAQCIENTEITVANYDVIIDTRFLGEKHLLIVQNSEIAQVLNIETRRSLILMGHEDIILCSSVLRINENKFVIATGAKDSRIMIHLYDNKSNELKEIGALLGHTDALTSLQLFNYSRNGSFVQLISTSNDTTIKMWKIKLPKIGGTEDDEIEEESMEKSEGDDEEGDDEMKDDEIAKCLFTTHQSHTKDINSTHISRNGLLIATGSQDRTVKLWKVQYKTEGSKAIKTAQSIVLQGTLQGHRRGIWDVAFSSVEQVLASCSSDGSVRIWNLATHQCIESYDVSENSLLRCRFVNNSLQIITTDSAGITYLVRFKTKVVTQLFQQKGVESTLPSSESTNTPAFDDDEDEFENKLWSLDVINEDMIDGDQKPLRIAIGGTGRVVDILEDCTREQKEEEQKARERILLQQEEFERHVRNGEFEESIRLGLALNMKMKVYTLLTQLDHEKKQLVLDGLDGKQLHKMLDYTEEWNTNTRSVLVAQEILEIILRKYTMQKLLDEVYDGNKQQFQQALTRLLPYTKSTFDHYNNLLVNARILSYF